MSYARNTNNNNDRELLSSNDNLKLFTFRKSPIEPELENAQQKTDYCSYKQPLASAAAGTSASRDQGGGDTGYVSSSSTAKRLLEMLSEKSSTRSSAANAPPVPPKPQCLEELTRNARGLSHMKNHDAFLRDGISNELSDDDDLEIRQPVHDSLYKGGASRVVSKANLTPREGPSRVQHQQLSKYIAPADYRGSSELNTDSDSEFSYHNMRPIVTEETEASTNIEIVSASRYRTRTNLPGSGTVEISEVVPATQHRKTYQSHGNNGNNSGNSSSTTFNKWHKQQQLFYENNEFPVPVITPATDDEEDQIYNYAAPGMLPSEMRVGSILNRRPSDDTNNPPPPLRSSTPNNNAQRRNGSTSDDDDDGSHSIATNNEETTIGDDDNVDNINVDDLANTSKDSDQAAKADILNESGGCELIGVADNSNSANNSKILNENNSERSYILQMLDQETSAYSSQSPPRLGGDATRSSDNSRSCDAECHKKIEKLEKLTVTLVSQIEDLKLQISDVASQVSAIGDSSRQVGNASNQTFDARSSTQLKFPLIDNTANMLAELSPQPSKVYPTGNNRTDEPTSTYSKQNVANIYRTLDAPQAAQSHHRPSSTTLRDSSSAVLKKPIYASTNSIYADNLKTGGSSTYLNQKSQSPMLTSFPGQRADPSAYNSMLSLSSIGRNSNASTTREEASALTGSVSNMSQVGSQQLTNRPSMNDFLGGQQSSRDFNFDNEERVIKMTLYNKCIKMRVPNWVEEDYVIDKVAPAPPVSLKLDWVHGYRGRDCRSNLHLLPTGECIYFVASIVVLYNPEERKQRHYLGHTDSVKCLAVHPNRLIVASGQSAILNRRDKRPIVRVWNTVNLNTLRVIEFNEDLDGSICCLAFSRHDQGSTLAVVDESTEHTISLLDWNKERNWRIGEANSGHDPVLAIEFHPIDKHTLVAVGKSTVNFWDTRGMTLSKKAGLFDKYTKPKFVVCLAFNDQGDTITGDSNGNLIIWPRGSNRPGRVINNCHYGGVFSVLAMKDGSYLTGGRDRRIVEWDSNFNRTGREAELPEHCGGVRYITYARGSQVLVGTLRNSILMGSLDKNFKLVMQGHAESISALAIHPKNLQYLTGGFDEQINLMDSTSHTAIWSKCLTMPVSAASFSPNAQLLVAGSTQGRWLVIDTASQEILFTTCDGTGTISCIKFSPNGDYFAMGSHDSNIYVYQTSEVGNKFCRVGTCVGHSAPVKELDWSDDGRYLQSQSMNLELLFWVAYNCRPLEDEEIIDDLKWFTHNCTIGFSVLGIWSDPADSSLVNHCDRSTSKDLLVSVTDTGLINLFRWPPYYGRSLSQRHVGNVDKLNSVKFLANDSKLIAIGSENCVVTEWTIQPRLDG